VHWAGINGDSISTGEAASLADASTPEGKEETLMYYQTRIPSTFSYQLYLTSYGYSSAHNTKK